MKERIYLLHDRNVISFGKHSDVKLYSINVRRRFPNPSVVFLNGCGTGSPGNVDFVRQFNEKGVGTIIATSAEVNPTLAGDFLDSFAKVIKENENNEKFTIAAAYFETLQHMRQRIPSDGDSMYGASVLEYYLLGNGNVRLCPPTK